MTQPAYVFAKPPRPGLSKTRLAATIGSATATMLARAFLEDTTNRLRSRGLAPVLATTDVNADFGLSHRWERVDQGAGSLGERIHRVLARGLAGRDWAMVIGADSPGLPDGHFDALAELAGSHDAVVIPARDGGFVALGVHRLPNDALRGVPWSSPQTCASVVAQLGAVGLSVATTEPWFDIDVEADLAYFRERVPRALAPATWRVLDDR